jgi:hypothetical protein
MFDLENAVMADEKWNPQKIIISGIQGLGKGTFGATFRDPFLIRTEDGAGALKIKTFPKIIESFEDMEAAIEALHVKHDYKTLVVDSLDWLEPSIWKKQIEFEPESEKGNEIKDIEDYGFGKGYTKVLQWWRYLMSGFDSLRFNKGMNIVLIAHTEIKKFEPPDTEPYDRYQIKLHKHAAALWQEWADIVLFCSYKTRIQKTDMGFNKTSNRGTGSGERMVYTEQRPAYLAKNRWGLPPEIYIGQDKAWAAFHEALAECTAGRYQIPNKLDTKQKKGATE